MKIVFFGTPDYVVPILSKIHKKFIGKAGASPIVAVVTQDPKPVGREQTLTYSPVDKWAHERGIKIFHKAQDLLNNYVEADLGILASYGEIIKKEVINMFPKGILVIHPSLLPKYRGPAPVQTAIKDGEKITGVSIIKMDEKMDHGPIISQFKEEIGPEDTGQSLRDRLFERSADVLAELIDPYLKGKIKLKVQDEKEASYTKLATKQDGFIETKEKTPEEVERFIRAMQPWPGAWTLLNEKRLKLIKGHMEGNDLVLDEVQLEGKNPVTGKQFQEAYPSFHLF